MVALLFLFLHIAELAGIAYLLYWKMGLPEKKVHVGHHGHCTVCDKKVAKWARPGVCVNCG